MTAGRIAQATGMHGSWRSSPTRGSSAAPAASSSTACPMRSIAPSPASPTPAQVILVGAKAPVAFFAYPGKPSSVLPEQCRVLEAAGPGDDLAERARRRSPNCFDVGRDVAAGGRANACQPDLPAGALTTAAIAHARWPC